MIKILSENTYLSDVMGELEKGAFELFSLSLSEKMRHFNPGQRGLTGYFPYRYEVTQAHLGPEDKEYWHLCRMNPFGEEEKTYYPANSWPDSLGSFYKTLEMLYLRLDALVPDILRIYVKNHGLPPEYLSFSRGNNIMRLLHYPGSQRKEPLVVAEHVDTTLFSLLLWSNQEGLEIQNEKGQWEELKRKNGEILLLEGNILERISGGKVLGTSHRVKRSSQSRFSLLFFVHPPPEFMIRSLPDSKGFQAPDILCRKLLSEHATELGLRNAYPMSGDELSLSSNSK